MVEIKCYSWPSTGILHASSVRSPSRSCSSSDAVAFCWHWKLSIPSAGGSLVAKVTVESGQLTRRDDSSPSAAVLDLETEPLRLKLARVQQWEPCYELDLRYRRLE